MTRTRSAKTLTELLVMIAVLFGLGGMLAHTVQKVCAAGQPQGRIEQGGADRAGAQYSLSLNGPSRGQAP